MAYLEGEFSMRVHPHSLRIRYQPSEDTIMIDISTIQSLELVRNLKDFKSKSSLYGLLNTTLTPMGARMLRNNIVQPSTLTEPFLTPRYDAVEELMAGEEMFNLIRKGENILAFDKKFGARLTLVQGFVGSRTLREY